ncbi:Piso0_002353 [Millerozyma farinosa CBS 7064]|uniref:Piso0_002353 protein n=1 Tax=Pichia sorbitophila (strain ATCC MYA-4447 / BCRC 22081 / CBS 7064 / NBRC 10061 / NRRL Y-12695) TaxID=559304 RepID=G8YCE0_PICSO|nr:Piso0_002353 [Millerozyma farinosa CBS 7064]
MTERVAMGSATQCSYQIAIVHMESQQVRRRTAAESQSTASSAQTAGLASSCSSSSLVPCRPSSARPRPKPTQIGETTILEHTGGRPPPVCSSSRSGRTLSQVKLAAQPFAN